MAKIDMSTMVPTVASAHALMRQLYLTDPSGCCMAPLIAKRDDTEDLNEPWTDCLRAAADNGHKLCGAVISVLNRMSIAARYAVIAHCVEPDPWEKPQFTLRLYVDAILDGEDKEIDRDRGASISGAFVYRERVVEIATQLAPQPGAYIKEQIDRGVEGAGAMLQGWNLLVELAKRFRDLPHLKGCSINAEDQTGCDCGHEELWRRALEIGAVQPIVHVPKLKGLDGRDL